MQQPIFIVGAARSGTTYLARALALTDDTAYFEESAAFSLYGARRFPRMFHQLLDAQPFSFNRPKTELLACTDRLRGKNRLADLINLMLLNTQVGPHDLTPSSRLIFVQECTLDDALLQEKARLIEAAKQMESDGFDAVCRMIMDDFVQRRNASRLIEKTPDHIFMVPVIRSVFPEARIIQIRRDKKSSIASYLKNFKARPTLRNRLLTEKMGLRKQCAACLECEQIELWLKEQPWCFSVAFQEMFEAPLQTVRAICEWADLALDVDRYGSYFKARKATSHWDELTLKEQREVARLLRLS